MTLEVARACELRNMFATIPGREPWWGRWGMGTLSINERPMCPKCKHRMGLARISPGNRGFEDRTFECASCHRIEKISFAIDLMKTGVGSVDSELKPPR
jgi:hypothetical protein